MYGGTTLHFWLGHCPIWYVSSQAKTCSGWIRQMQVAWDHLCTFPHSFLNNNFLWVGFCKTLLPLINSTISRTDTRILAMQGAVLNNHFRFIAEKEEGFENFLSLNIGISLFQRLIVAYYSTSFLGNAAEKTAEDGCLSAHTMIIATYKSINTLQLAYLQHLNSLTLHF